MSKDEVELGSGDSDDYEVVPVGPIRKLERRIDEIESQGGAGSSAADDELVKDVLDIMKSNQKIVNDMTESTHQLKNEVEDLTHKMDEVVDNMNSFMDLLKEASEADLEGEVIQDVHSKIADAVGNEMEQVATDMKESNKHVIQHLEQLNKSVRRSYTSQKKDQIMSGSQQGQKNQGGRQESQNSPSIDVNRDNSNQKDQANRSQQNSSGEGSERMRKLRERFEKQKNE